MKDIEGAFRAACALQRDVDTYCAAKACIKVRFRLDEAAARKVLATRVLWSGGEAEAARERITAGIVQAW
jgi:hypothetical protein